MPTYEYECGVCGPFEQFQRITEDPLADCPRCGSAVRRLISSGTGIIFKGSGFYSTDSRNTGKEPGSSSGDGDGSGGNGKDGAGTDAGKAGAGKTGAGKEKGGAAAKKEPAAAATSTAQGSAAKD